MIYMSRARNHKLCPFLAYLLLNKFAKIAMDLLHRERGWHQTKGLATCNFLKVKSSKLCSVSPCCFVLQVMLFSIKENGGCKIGAYTSRAGLNLGAVQMRIKMRVEQGKKRYSA
jgi:hypothetical protein